MFDPLSLISSISLISLISFPVWYKVGSNFSRRGSLFSSQSNNDPNTCSLYKTLIKSWGKWNGVLLHISEFCIFLNDVKNKLKLQSEQRELYEKQHCEMMKILNIPTKNQCFSNILPAIRELKESFEKNEIAHYEIAESVLKSQSFANRD